MLDKINLQEMGSTILSEMANSTIGEETSTHSGHSKSSATIILFVIFGLVLGAFIKEINKKTGVSLLKIFLLKFHRSLIHQCFLY